LQRTLRKDPVVQARSPLETPAASRKHEGMPNPSRFLLAAIFGGVLALVSARGEAWRAEPAPDAGEEGPLPLDAQRCNTDCQDRFTQCLLDCDGKPSCMRGCKQTAASCVAGCSAPEAPPSGSGPVVGPGGSVAPSGSVAPGTGRAPNAGAPGGSAKPPAPPPAPKNAGPFLMTRSVPPF
jgi:hypothetical protein